MTTRSRAPKIKKTKHLTLRDRLSRLNDVQACKLLGPEGDKLIRQGENSRSTSSATCTSAAIFTV